MAKLVGNSKHKSLWLTIKKEKKKATSNSQNYQKVDIRIAVQQGQRAENGKRFHGRNLLGAHGFWFAPVQMFAVGLYLVQTHKEDMQLQTWLQFSEVPSSRQKITVLHKTQNHFHGDRPSKCSGIQQVILFIYLMFISCPSKITYSGQLTNRTTIIYKQRAKSAT